MKVRMAVSTVKVTANLGLPWLTGCERGTSVLLTSPYRLWETLSDASGEATGDPAKCDGLENAAKNAAHGDDPFLILSVDELATAQRADRFMMWGRSE